MAPTVNVDFSDVKGFEPIPQGTYSAIIENVELRDSKSTEGNQNINWEFTVNDGGEFDGRKLFMTTSLAPKALFRLKGVMESLGFEASEALSFDFDDETKQVIEPELIGRTVTVKVSQDTYQGRLVNRVDDVVGGDVPVAAGSNGKSFK